MSTRFYGRDFSIRASAVALFLCLHPCMAASEEFTDTKARFSATFPSKPFYEVSPPQGDKVAFHKYRTQGLPYTLAVAFQDVKPEFLSGVSIIAICRESAEEAFPGGQIRSLVELQLGGVPGCEIRAGFGHMRGPLAPAIRSRYFLAGSRLYEVTYFGNEEHQESAPVNTFFETFRLH
jgi:hypothetical protein